MAWSDLEQSVSAVLSQLAAWEEDSVLARFCRPLPPLAVLGAALAVACHRAPPPLTPQPVTPAPQAVLLRIHAQAGQARRVRIAVDNFMHFGPGEPPSGDSARPILRLVQFATESVTAISGDTITVVLVTDSSRMEVAGGDLPGAMLDRAIPAGLAVTTRMDSRGRAISINVKGSPPLDEQMASIRKMLPGIDTSGGESRGTYTRLPDRPVRAGETWTDSARLPPALATAGGSVVATYRLEGLETRAERRLAIISFDVATPPMAIETPMRVSTGPMHAVGELQLDLDAGWIVRQSMTMTGATHTEMGDVSMRMVMRQGPLGEEPASVPPIAPRILIRRVPAPPVITLAALLALYKQTPEREPLPAELAQCQLPDVVPGADWATMEGPDQGFRLRLPPGWRARPPGDSILGEPETVLEDTAGGRIRVIRVLIASGRPVLATRAANGPPVERTHTGPCQVGTGPAGSVWTFYPPNPAVTSGTSPRYTAIGDVITAAGGRYRVTVGASSGEERDRLVRIASEAAQAAGP